MRCRYCGLEIREIPLGGSWFHLSSTSAYCNGGARIAQPTEQSTQQCVHCGEDVFWHNRRLIHINSYSQWCAGLPTGQSHQAELPPEVPSQFIHETAAIGPPATIQSSWVRYGITEDEYVDMGEPGFPNHPIPPEDLVILAIARLSVDRADLEGMCLEFISNLGISTRDLELSCITKYVKFREEYGNPDIPKTVRRIRS